MAKQTIYNAGIYVRLSQEDMRAGESLSIEHQKLILTKYVREQGWNLVDTYVDDGFSGTDFNRPSVQRLLSDAQTGRINLIICKDLSRFGRNYIEVGQYIDYIFPLHNIRFIALNDNVDTANRDSNAMEMMPVINLFNEWHASSTSKKIKAVNLANAKAGKYTCANAAYGYTKADDEKHTPIIDPEAAEVVRRIFKLRSQGMSPRAIGDQLNAENIPLPSDYRCQKKRRSKQMSSSTKTGQKLRKRFKKELPFHLMLLPAVVMVVLFKYIPMAGLSIAFQDYSPLYSIFEQEWCGWENFKYIFSLSTFPRVIYNTLFIAIMKIAAGIIVPVTVALLLNEVRNIVYKRTLQTIVYLPHFISWVALAGIFLDVLGMDGIVNNFFATIGLHRVYFLGDEKVFPFTMVVTDTWKTFGWNTIVYLAAITGISPALYEAAALDGAGRFRQIIHVAIPSILPIVLLMTVLSIGNVLRAGFDQIFNLYSPLVYSTGDIIDTFVYRMGILGAQFGPATAVGLFQSVVSCVLIVAGYWAAEKFAGYQVF